MEKLISIIIPTYNMEAYILKALESLVIPRNWRIASQTSIPRAFE